MPHVAQILSSRSPHCLCGRMTICPYNSTVPTVCTMYKCRQEDIGRRCLNSLLRSPQLGTCSRCLARSSTVRLRQPVWGCSPDATSLNAFNHSLIVSGRHPQIILGFSPAVACIQAHLIRKFAAWVQRIQSNLLMRLTRNRRPVPSTRQHQSWALRLDFGGIACIAQAVRVKKPSGVPNGSTYLSSRKSFVSFACG